MDNIVDRMRSIVVGYSEEDDAELWDVAHKVAADSSLPMPERLEALVRMNELTGEDDPCTEEALMDYLRDTVE